MIQLTDFEGISGFRWGALLSPDGTIQLGGRAPDAPDQKIALIGRMLERSGDNHTSANFIFDLGKVLMRRGPFGMLLLFCDDNINVSLINLVLKDQPESKDLRSRPNLKTGSATDSSLSLVQTMDLDQRPVPPDVITEVLECYSEVLGPLAVKLAQKDARDNGLDLKTLPRRRWSNFLNILAARIDTETKRNKFLDRVVLLKNKF